MLEDVPAPSVLTPGFASPQAFFDLVGKKPNQTYDDLLHQFPNLKKEGDDGLTLPVSPAQCVAMRSMQTKL